MPALQKTFVFFSWNLAGNFALKNGGDFWSNFSGLRFAQNDARAVLKKFGKILSKLRGNSSKTKSGNFRFVPFSDLATFGVGVWSVFGRFLFGGHE